jgi:ABC-type transport system involved in multi-copper enzyme maturation permease subunit
MNSTMMRALLWKELRQSRGMLLLLVASFHVFILAESIHSLFEQTPYFMTYNDLNGPWHWLSGQCMFLITLGVLFVAFFAAGCIQTEFKNRSIYYLFDRPITRQWILLVKFLVLGGEVFLAAFASLFTTLAAGYLLFPVLWQPALTNNWPKAGLAFHCALPGGLLIGLLLLAVFSSSFALSLYFEKWWVGWISGTLFMIGSLIYFIISMMNAATRSLIHHQSPMEISGSIVSSTPHFVLIPMIFASYFVASCMIRRKQI